MTTPYAMTYRKAAHFALVPGKAERILYDSYRFSAKEFSHVTACILLSRYGAVFGIGLGILSAVKATSPWPTLLSATLTIASTAELHRYTKLFMATVDGPKEK